MRHIGMVAVVLAALAVPTVALADTTRPVDVQIRTRQPAKVGLGETFVVGTATESFAAAHATVSRRFVIHG